MSRVIRRLLWAIPTLLAVLALTFFLMRAAPGGPFDKEKAIPAHIKQQLMANYKLDGPVHKQFWWYLQDVMRGDLRLSTKYRDRSVNEIVAQTLPVSLTLGVWAFAIAVLGGVAAGAWAAARHNSWTDILLMLGALAGISLPSFVLGPLLAGLFCFWLGWLPVGGWGQPAQLILPALALGLPYMAYVARLVRGSMLEVLGADYIRTARAKGVQEWRTLFLHALRNASLPLVSFCGPLAANILTGSLVIEEVFKIPGLGTFFVNGVLNRDVFLVGGVTLVYSAMLIGFNILVDLLLLALDSRIRET